MERIVFKKKDYGFDSIRHAVLATSGDTKILYECIYVDKDRIAGTDGHRLHIS